MQQNGIYAIYADQGTGSIDLMVQKLNANFEPEWGETGLIAMDGLDGDVNYTKTYRLGDQSLFHVWEDNRASKKLYGNKLTELILLSSNGTQISFGDNSSSETIFHYQFFSMLQVVCIRLHLMDQRLQSSFVLINYLKIYRMPGILQGSH